MLKKKKRKKTNTIRRIAVDTGAVQLLEMRRTKSFLSNKQEETRANKKKVVKCFTAKMCSICSVDLRVGMRSVCPVCVYCDVIVCRLDFSFFEAFAVI